MKKNFSIKTLFFNFSFFQAIIYFSNYLFKESLSYCSFNSNKLTNIINIGKENFRYVNFASYSNGDMVFLTSSYILINYLNPSKNERIFYGLKKNGRPLFKDSYFYSTTVTDGSKYESESLVVKESGNNNNETEYLMSFAKESSFVEIYDFKKGITYKKNLQKFLDNTISSYRHAFISLFSNDTNYFYLLGFINDDKKFVIQKHIFYSLQNLETENTLNKTITIKNLEAKSLSGFTSYVSGISCFQTERHFIICFFLNKVSNYLIVAYNLNLEEIKNVYISSNINSYNNVFYKCLLLKGDIGVFTYYEDSNPVLLFKEFNSTDFNNYTIPEIILDKIGNPNLDDDLLLNDIIKLNENKIYYSSTDSTKENIYIISIYLYDDKYKIRYYLINILKYGYKIYQEMRMHNYNNFIAFAFSHNDYYNSLLIFSYPTSTDYNLSLIQKLFENSNHSDIYINININLENKEKPRIENNIFGHVFSGIIILDLENCYNLDLISSISNDKIGPNCTLPINGSIKLDFNNNYTKSICNIQYSYKTTEPDLECYDSYIKYYDGHNETDGEFNDSKIEYIGRLNYYNISLNESLIENCKDPNCKLCLESNNSSCIICKYNNTFSYDKRTKICLDQVTVNKYFFK